MVPVSIGAKEFGECVTMPAAFIFLEKYFCVPGKILQPDPKRQVHSRNSIIRDFEVELQNAFIFKYKYLRLDESIRNIRKSKGSSWLNGME
jgi:hypothetical protein